MQTTASKRAKPSLVVRVVTSDGRKFYLGQQRAGRVAGPISRLVSSVLITVYKYRRRHEFAAAGSN